MPTGEAPWQGAAYSRGAGVFAPLVAKPQAKTETDPATRRREARVARRFASDASKLAQMPGQIGDASARAAPRGVAWDFSKVSVSPPDLAETKQRQVTPAAAGPEPVASRGSLPLAPGRRIQAKLRVSEPDDPEEHEADRLAETLTTEGEAMNFAGGAATPEPGPESQSPASQSPASQSSDWWDEVHRKAADHTVPDTGDSLYGRLQTRLGHGSELPDGPRSSMEFGFRANFVLAAGIGLLIQFSLRPERSLVALFLLARLLFLAFGKSRSCSRHSRLPET